MALVFAFAFAFAVALVIELERVVPARQVRVGELVVPVVLEDSVDSWFQDVACGDGRPVAHDSAIAASAISAVDVFLFFSKDADTTAHGREDWIARGV